jgi:hypothetical protein
MPAAHQKIIVEDPVRFLTIQRLLTETFAGFASLENLMHATCSFVFRA